MADESNDSKKPEQYDPYNWERNHGMIFLSQVLCELGYPNEPDETLLEILKEVHRVSKAYIINWDDADYMINKCRHMDFEIQKDKFRVIESRIKAREQRIQNEKNESDEIPF